MLTSLPLLCYSGEQIYDDVGETFTESEACLNSGLIEPSLKACVRMLRINGYDISYLPAEVELNSMTVQLTKEGLLDNRFKYNADGKIRINANKQEPLIVEVSSGLDQGTQEKIDFDHSKAMFGMLAVLKTIADKYNYGSFEDKKSFYSCLW